MTGPRAPAETSYFPVALDRGVVLAVSGRCREPYNPLSTAALGGHF